MILKDDRSLSRNPGAFGIFFEVESDKGKFVQFVGKHFTGVELGDGEYSGMDRRRVE